MAQNFMNYSNDRNSYWKNDGPNLYTPMKGTSAVGASVFRPSANVKNKLGINDGNSSGSGSSGGYGGGYGGYSSSAYSYGPVGYDLDLSAFQRARDAIIENANRSRNMLKNQYDRLLAELDKKTKEGNEQFGRGRSTITEDAYDRSRENLNNLASRGLAGSGLQQLGEVQERMETGQQMNDLASQYYAYLDDLDSQRQQGEAQYNEGLQAIESSLQQQLANIGLQEFQAQDDYNRYMSNLAMQMAEVANYNAGRSIVSGNASNELAELQSALSDADTALWQYQNDFIDDNTYKAVISNIQGSASGLPGFSLNDWSKYIIAQNANNTANTTTNNQNTSELYPIIANIRNNRNNRISNTVNSNYGGAYNHPLLRSNGYLPR